MTLDEFRATGRDCDDLSAALDDASDLGAGRLYLGKLYISRRPATGWPNGADGGWHLILDPPVEYLSDDLPRLEALLYEWALAEEYINGQHQR